MTVGFVTLFLDEFSKTVGFVLLREFNDGQNLWEKFTKFQWWLVLCGYETSMMVEFVPLYLYEISKADVFFPIRDFKDGQFCFVTRFQYRSVLFSYEISMTAGFFSFVPLQDFKDCRLGNEISKTVVLFRYEISMMVGFVRLWDLSDGRFCSFVPLGVFKDGRFALLREFNDGRNLWKTFTKFQWWSLFSVMRSQWWSVLFCYESLMMVEIYWKNIQNFNDGRFCSLMWSQWR